MAERDRQLGDVLVQELDDGVYHCYYVSVVGDTMPYEDTDVFQTLPEALAEAHKRLKIDHGKIWLVTVQDGDDLE